MQASSPPPFRSGSPPQTNGLAPDPKRQKLSHGPSPLATSHSPSNYAQPYSPQWSPHTSFPSNPYQQPPPSSVAHYPPNPLDSFNQPQAVQSPSFEVQPQPPQGAGMNQQRQGGGAAGGGAGAMGPPERPQKPLDPNDITDMVALSGVDLRAEDEFLANSYHRSSFNASFDTTQSGSNTQSQGSNSFQQWSQGNFGSQPAFNAGPPFSQQPVNEVSLEEELRRKHKRAARQYAESKQAHLRDPFLQAQSVRERIHKRAYEEHVRFSTQGLRDEGPRAPGNVLPQDVNARYQLGSDGKGVVKADVVHKLEMDSPLVEVLSLLSLACNERMRSCLEDAFAVSRSRRYGSGGVVPPEWKSIATGEGKPEDTTAVPQSITGTSWDRPAGSPASEASQQLKPADPNGRLPTPPTEPSPPPQPTIRYQSTLPAVLQSIATSDLAYERARIEKRKARKATASAAGSTEASATPAPAASEIAPAADAPPVKMTKKALAAEKKSAVNDEVQRKQANATANMALGGGKKSKYSWLNKGAGGGGGGLSVGAGMGKGVGNTPKSSAPSTPGPSTTGGVAAPKAVAEDPGLKAKAGKKLGSWDESGEEGKGVQIRDLINVLERDSLERKTLARCYGKLRDDAPK